MAIFCLIVPLQLVYNLIIASLLLFNLAFQNMGQIYHPSKTSARQQQSCKPAAEADTRISC
jgi:hypothetical protein